MAAKQRIAFVANTSWSIYKFRLYLIERLLKKGLSIVVLAPRDAYTAFFEDLEGLTFIDLRHFHGTRISPVADYRLYKELLHHYRTIRPHLIFHYTIKANIFGTIAAHRAGIPSISVITGLGYAIIRKGWLSRTVKLFYKNILPKSKETWVLNEDDKTLLIREHLRTPGSLFVLPGEGVDTETFFPAPFQPGRKEIVFLFVGRMLRDKGVYEFVAAARQLRRQGLAVHCQLLGIFDENPAAIPRQKIEEWHREGVISYLGHTDDVAGIMEKADCIVLPSYQEGMPMSLLEGASMCKALIAADTPGCRSAVEDGVNGYLCREKDSEDLAQKMMTYYRLPAAEKERMGRAGRQKVLEKYTCEHITRIYLEKINTLAHSPVHPV
ncbi:MAG TPA: glycosyltransferase family 4 protein [Puia sp.]|nr:glycosyltransferase family 4 protein [Puia sp.]